MGLYGPGVDVDDTVAARLALTLSQLIDNLLTAGAVPATGSVTDAKVAANAAIAQSKIAGLVTDLAAKLDAAAAVVKVAATTNMALSGLPIIDGYQTIAGDRALLTAQATASQNGPWVTAAGAWARPADFAAGAVITGRSVVVAGGSTLAGTLWSLSGTTPVTVDTSAQIWANSPVRSGTYAGALIATSVKTANYTAAPKDYVLVDTTAGAVAVTLPTAPADGSRIGIKIVAPSPVVNIVTFSVGGGDHINLTTGPTSGTISKVNQAVILQYTASTAVWTVQSSDLPLSAVIASDGAQTVTPNLTINPANGGAALTIQIRTAWTSSDGGPDASLRWVNEAFAVGSPYRYGAYFAREGHFATGLAILASNKRMNATGLIQGISSVADGSEGYMIGSSPDINGPTIAGEAHGNMTAPDYENQAAFAAYDLDDVSGGATGYSPGYGKKKWMISGKGDQFWGTDLQKTPLTRYDVKMTHPAAGKLTVQSADATDTVFTVASLVGTRHARLRFNTQWEHDVDTNGWFHIIDTTNGRDVLFIQQTPATVDRSIFFDGMLRPAQASMQRNTVGAAGAAAAMPTPIKYIDIMLNDGTSASLAVFNRGA